MKKVYDNCCGIDVHKKLIAACDRKQEVRKFGATTRELLSLADWLLQGDCQMTAMESTGFYWKPLYNVLETCGLEAIMVNARHEGCTRAEDGYPRRRADCRPATAWPSAAELHI